MNSFFSGGSACEVTVCKEIGIVRKKVHYQNQGIENGHDKLLGEAEFINRMNEDGNWFPQIVNQYYNNNHELVVELEYLYHGCSFADLIFNQSVTDEYLIKSLCFIMEKLFSEFYTPLQTSVNGAYWKKCYLDRTRRRMNVTLELIANQFPRWTKLKNAIQNGITINQIHYNSIYCYLDYIEANLLLPNELPLYGAYRTHHDLIPENIMVECGNQSILEFKLIDPRSDYETGIDCRHFIYDMGKMMFGLDCYGLFRRTHKGLIPKEFVFNCVGSDEYMLCYNADSRIVHRLMMLQRNLIENFTCLAKEKESKLRALEKYLFFAFSFMYIPDVPCRVIDEQNETLALAFYARGILSIHQMMLKMFSEDALSSDRTGKDFQLWELKGRDL